MFVVLLKFSRNRDQAAKYMEGHQAWIRQGFDEGVFLLTGSLEGKQGGAVLAHGVTREALEARVNSDPFVREEVVQAEITELLPSRMEPRLQFLMQAV